MLKQISIEVSIFAQNCRLIWDDGTRDAFILDPGGDSRRIIEAVKEYELNIQKVILTHGHPDHIAAAPSLREYFQVEIWGCHKDDEVFFMNLPDQMAYFGMNPVTERFLPDSWLNEGDVLELESCELEVLHCPGHSPGHVVFINHKDKQVFVGDVLFNGSVGRTDLPLGDFAALSRSIKDKLYVLDDDYLVFPGHGRDTSIGREKRSNPFVNGAIRNMYD